MGVGKVRLLTYADFTPASCNDVSFWSCNMRKDLVWQAEEDWPGATTLLLEGCERLSRKEMSGVCFSFSTIPNPGRRPGINDHLCRMNRLVSHHKHYDHYGCLHRREQSIPLC